MTDLLDPARGGYELKEVQAEQLANDCWLIRWAKGVDLENVTPRALVVILEAFRVNQVTRAEALELLAMQWCVLSSSPADSNCRPLLPGTD